MRVFIVAGAEQEPDPGRNEIGWGFRAGRQPFTARGEADIQQLQKGLASSGLQIARLIAPSLSGAWATARVLAESLDLDAEPNNDLVRPEYMESNLVAIFREAHAVQSGDAVLVVLERPQIDEALSGEANQFNDPRYLFFQTQRPDRVFEFDLSYTPWRLANGLQPIELPNRFILHLDAITQNRVGGRFFARIKVIAGDGSMAEWMPRYDEPAIARLVTAFESGQSRAVLAGVDGPLEQGNAQNLRFRNLNEQQAWLDRMPADLPLPRQRGINDQPGGVDPVP